MGTSDASGSTADDVELLAGGAGRHQWDAAVRFGVGARARARVLAPNGTISVGASADAEGSLIARDVAVGLHAQARAFHLLEIVDFPVPSPFDRDQQEVTLTAHVSVGSLPDDPAACPNGCNYFLAYYFDIRQGSNVFPLRRSRKRT